MRSGKHYILKSYESQFKSDVPEAQNVYQSRRLHPCRCPIKWGVGGVKNLNQSLECLLKKDQITSVALKSRLVFPIIRAGRY
jgi:hypothetical protein